MLDAVMTITKEKDKITLSIVNKDLYQDKKIELPESILKSYLMIDAQVLTAQDVHQENTFEKPNQVTNRRLSQLKLNTFVLEKHSVTRFILQK